MSTEDMTSSKGRGQPTEADVGGSRVLRGYKRASLQRTLRSERCQLNGPMVAYEGNEVIEEISIVEYIDEKPLHDDRQLSARTHKPKLSALLVLVFLVLLFSRTEVGSKLVDSVFGALDVMDFARIFLK